MITTIGDEPANIEAMKTVPDSVFETLGDLPRGLETFLKSGIFQRPGAQQGKDRRRLDRSAAGVIKRADKEKGRKQQLPPFGSLFREAFK
jgi:hypothetical protein